MADSPEIGVGVDVSLNTLSLIYVAFTIIITTMIIVLLVRAAKK